jgi:hypothetical protein
MSTKAPKLRARADCCMNQMLLKDRLLDFLFGASVPRSTGSSGTKKLVGSHLSSFFVNDGRRLPDLVHAVRFEQDKRGSLAEDQRILSPTTFVTQHPESLLAQEFSL